MKWRRRLLALCYTVNEPVIARRLFSWHRRDLHRRLDLIPPDFA